MDGPKPMITEFEELDPEEFHLVSEGATGFPVLLAKAVADAVADVRSQPTRPWIAAAPHEGSNAMSNQAETVLAKALAPLERKVEQLTKAVKAGDAEHYELVDARRDLALLKMVLAENAREGRAGRWGPGTTEIFKSGSTHKLGDDPKVGGI